MKKEWYLLWISFSKAFFLRVDGLCVADANMNQMKIEEVKERFNYNTEYIYEHQLNTEADRVAEDEIFIMHPEWSDYFISQYGRAISVKKNGEQRLLGLLPGGRGFCYYYYRFCEPSIENGVSVSAHRAVADIFCPNFWQDRDRNKLQAHHLDGNKVNNYFKNLILLPGNLHWIMDRVEDVALFHDNAFHSMTPYEIMETTRLTLNEIIMSAREKPIMDCGKYAVHSVYDYLIGFKLKAGKDIKYAS